MSVLEKISRYNLSNYLLPGIVFIAFTSKTTEFDIIKLFNENLVIILFLAYFTGTIISRIGSLIFEPILRKIKFVTFAKYPDYLEVQKIDKKLDDLSEENNTYRTYISLFAILLIFYLFIFLAEYFSLYIKDVGIILVGALFVLFLFSYRKQTNYIRSRVNKNLNK
ncbi:hypothetical protein HN615_14895 [Candidatus Woesearchaeota archaeon]|nr:hypothetical protein [Candidatus Woesearchaeota archaeon]